MSLLFFVHPFNVLFNIYAIHLLTGKVGGGILLLVATSAISFSALVLTSSSLITREQQLILYVLLYILLYILLCVLLYIILYILLYVLLYIILYKLLYVLYVLLYVIPSSKNGLVLQLLLFFSYHQQLIVWI